MSRRPPEHPRPKTVPSRGVAKRLEIEVLPTDVAVPDVTPLIVTALSVAIESMTSIPPPYSNALEPEIVLSDYSLPTFDGVSAY